MNLESPRTAFAAAAAGVGIIGLVTGCGGSDTTTTTTATSTTTEATTTTAAASGGTTAGSTSGTLPPAPSGSVELQNENSNGILYQRWSNSSATPQQIISEYQTALEADGYTVTDTGGGGGGWGKWGGAGAGLNASRSGSFVSVQAGGQTGQPVFFEVCQGANQQATDECENQSDGPDSNSQGS